MLRLRVCLAALALTLTVASSASAISVFDSASFSGETTELVNRQLRVDRFTVPVGHVLTRVIVTASGTLTSTGNVTNTSAGPATITATTRAQQYQGSVAGIDPPPVALPSFFDVFVPFTLIGSQTYTNLAVNTPTAFGPYTANSGTLTLLDTTNPMTMSQFIGASEFGYDLNTSIFQGTSGAGGNVNFSTTTTAGGFLQVEYQYQEQLSEVPEPASLALLGTGLVGAAWRARRRKQAQAS